LLLPEVDEPTADIGIFDPERAVQIPGRTDPSLTSARFMVRDIVVELRVIVCLQFPADDPVLHVNHPAAAAGTVDAVDAPHNLVILPPVPVKLLPIPCSRCIIVLDPF